MEGEEVSLVPCDHLHPAPLTFARSEAAGEPMTVSARTSFSSTVSGHVNVSALVHFHPESLGVYRQCITVNGVTVPVDGFLHQ